MGIKYLNSSKGAAAAFLLCALKSRAIGKQINVFFRVCGTAVLTKSIKGSHVAMAALDR